MLTAPAMTECHGQMLGALAQMAFELAQEMHGRARAAQTPQDAERYVAAFHKAARAARMSMALEAKAARDQRAEDKAQAEVAAAAAAELAKAKDAGRNQLRVARYIVDPIARGSSWRFERERELLLDPENARPDILIEARNAGDVEADEDGIRLALSKVIARWAAAPDPFTMVDGMDEDWRRRHDPRPNTS